MIDKYSVMKPLSFLGKAIEVHFVSRETYLKNGQTVFGFKTVSIHLWFVDKINRAGLHFVLYFPMIVLNEAASPQVRMIWDKLTAVHRIKLTISKY